VCRRTAEDRDRGPPQPGRDHARRRYRRGRRRPPRRAVSPMPTPSPQLPLALRYPPDQRLETFAGDPALVAQLRAFATGAGGDRALLLVGPAGTGKSHLALAACAEADSAGHRVGYLPL